MKTKLSQSLSRSIVVAELLTLICFNLVSSLAQGPAQRKPTTQTSSAAMFRAGPSHHGVFAGDGAPSFRGLQWRLQTGGGVFSSPIVTGGVVYIGSNDGFLYAIDACDGTVRWKFNANSAVSSSPAVADGAVYFGARDGRFYSLAAETGKVNWSLQTGPDLPLAWGHESGDFLTSSPTVVDRQVLFGSGDGFVYCVTGTNGRPVWRFKTGGRVRSSPAVDAGSVYVGSQDGRVYAIDLKTGAQKWVYETEGVKLDSSKFGYDRKTIQSSPAVSAGIVHIGARDGFLYALAAADGHLLWRIDHEKSWVNDSPAVVGNVVYVGSSDLKFIQSVDAGTGQEHWRFKTEGVVWSSPAVSGNTVCAGDGTGALYVLDRQTGKQLWRYSLPNKIHSSPAVVAGRLYFGSEDGGVYALNVAAGPELKRAVYWDTAFTKESSVRGSTLMRDYFKNRGYEVLDGPAPTTFLKARVSDHGSSVVVFAMDQLPDEVLSKTAEVTLLRKYLDAGGKVVWPGLPPLLWPFDKEADGRTLPKVDRDAAEKLLGVGFQKGNFDQVTAIATSEGNKWGQSGWWLSIWSADPARDITILARDEQGLAAAWVRRYGGPEGTGFIKISVVPTASGAPANLLNLQTAAEYMPLK